LEILDENKTNELSWSENRNLETSETIVVELQLSRASNSNYAGNFDKIKHDCDERI
jgi:hypothetical protein